MVSNTEPRNVLILELVDNALQSWWTFVAAVCLGLAGSLIVLAHTPSVYEAVARLNLSSEKLPREFFNDTVPGDDDPDLQLAVLRQSVLSEPYLDSIVSQVFDPVATAAQRAVLANRVRANVRVVRPMRSNYFQIRYRDNDPHRAATIANLLAKIYVEENLKLRVRGAQETVETLDGLVNRKLQELQDKRREISEFRAKHPQQTDADLPETRVLLRDARSELEKLREGRSILEEQVDLLQVQKEQGQLIQTPSLERPAGTGTSSGLTLATLEAELRDLLIKYSDNHPDVVKKRKQIETYRELAGHEPEPEPAPESPPERQSDFSVWDVQITSALGEIKKLGTEEKRIRSRIAEYERRLAGTPGIQNRLEELDNEVTILEREYGELRTRAERAKSSEMVEEAGRGSQFEIIDAAAPPSTPFYPQPVRMHTVAIALGLLLFVGPIMVRGILLPVIGSEARLAAATDVPVLVAIPTITTPLTSGRRRKLWMKNIFLALLCITALVAVLGLRFAGEL